MSSKYSKYFSSRYILIFVSLFCFVCLIAFKPFGLHLISGSDLIIQTLFFEIAIFTSCYLSLYIYNISVPYDKVGVPFLIIAAIASSSATIYLLGFIDFFVQIKFLIILRDLSLIGLIPSILIWLYFDRIFYSTYFQKSQRTTELIHKRINQKAIKKHKETLVIKGKNQDNKLELFAEDIIFLKAQENYCHIYYLNEHKEFTSKLFRESLCSLHEQIPKSTNIIRCHRTYVVNLNHVLEMHGNSRGYHLKLDDKKTEIPVSRNFPDILNLKESFYYV